MNVLLKTKENFFWLPSTLMILSAMMKVLNLVSSEGIIFRLGLQEKIVLLGIIEMGCTLVFVFPRTMMVGFFLLCSYLGGAIASGLIGDQITYAPLIILILFWVAVYLKMPSVFTNPH